MSKGKSLLKTAGIIIGIFILLGVIVYALTGLMLEPLLKKRISKRLSEVTQVDTVTFERFDIKTFSGSVYMEGVEVMPPEIASLEKSSFKLNISKIGIEGLNLLDLIFNNEILIDEIDIDSPSITLYQVKSDSSSKKTQSDSTKSKDRFNIFMIDELFLTNGSVNIQRVRDSTSKKAGSAEFSIKGLTIKYDFSDETLPAALTYKTLQANLKNVSYTTPKGIRKVELDNLNLKASENYLTASGITLNTLYDKYELGHELGHEADWIDLTIPNINISGFKLDKLVSGAGFMSSSIALNNIEMNVFRDKRLPFPQKKDTQLPYAFLNDLSTKLSIDTLSISSADITYQEHVEAMEEAGTITFNELNGTITNITNIPEVLEQNGRKGYMSASALLMGASKLSVDMVFNLEENATHRASGYLNSMNLTTLNPMISKVGYAEIQSGQLDSLGFEFSYDEQSSSGTIMMLYNKLKVQILSKQDGEGKPIMTFLGDFIIDDDNSGPDAHNGKIELNRSKKKSLLNYWWKSLLSGILNNVGAEGKADKLDEKKPK